MNDLPRPIADALEALEDAGLQREVLAEWTRPYEWLLVGLSGAGKTTLLNRMLDADHPVGLGGVTRGVHRVTGGPGTVIDTQGIDASPVARAVLAEPMISADALVWVIDGLSPSTSRERDVITTLRPGAMPLHLVLSRRDLLEHDDLSEVLTRLARLHPDAASTTALDLRNEPLPEPLTAGHLPSAPRRKRVRERFTERLAQLPEAPSAADITRSLTEPWRQGVVAVRDAVLADVDTGTLPDAGIAMTSLVRQSARRVAELRQTPLANELLRSLHIAPPDLPGVGAPSTSALHALEAGVAGRAGAARAVREAVGRWRLDGDAAIADWGADVLAPATLRAEVARREVIARLEAAIAYLDAR